MTEDEHVYRIEALFAKMFDRLDNVDGRIDNLEREFIEYIDHNPIVDEQWAEERLRALEHDVKKVREEIWK